jgi:hypothetical protein
MGKTARPAYGFFLLLLGVLAVRDGHAQPVDSITDPTSRLRPVSNFEAAIIGEGSCRSATLRSLIAILQTSNVIVYVTMRRMRDRTVAGSLEFLGATTTDRILRIVLAFPLDRAARITMLGHELQHAIEVAGEPGIRSRPTFDSFYRGHGLPGATASSWDTDAARRIQLRVRQELAVRSASCGGSYD